MKQDKTPVEPATEIERQPTRRHIEETCKRRHTEMETAVIQVGDFIASKSMRVVCGFVVAVGHVRFGKKQLPAYTIRLANGRCDVIPAEDAVFVAR